MTVILNKDDYNRKMLTLLNDSNTYELTNKNPVQKITENLRSPLIRWKNKGFIDEYTYKNLLVTDGLISRAYGLPKIHKEGHPLKIIVSSINSTLHPLALFLHNILKNSLKQNYSDVKNSESLKRELLKVDLTTNLKLALLDVVSLFTNVPIHLINDSIKHRWNEITENTKIDLDEFLHGINLILNSTFFKFDNKYYKQIFGTPWALRYPQSLPIKFYKISNN